MLEFSKGADKLNTRTMQMKYKYITNVFPLSMLVNKRSKENRKKERDYISSRHSTGLKYERRGVSKFQELHTFQKVRAC